MSRTNQKARTRLALIRAASELIEQGASPSMPDAAERALVSVATAYRYYRSAEELWNAAVNYDAPGLDEEGVQAALDAAGDDVEARLEAVISGFGFWMIDNPDFIRRSAKAHLDSVFAQQARGEEPTSDRPRRRTPWNARIVEPLRGQVEDHHIDAIVEALGLAWGVEPVITLLDVLDLSPQAAKERMLTTAQWILRAGLAETG